TGVFQSLWFINSFVWWIRENSLHQHRSWDPKNFFRIPSVCSGGFLADKMNPFASLLRWQFCQVVKLSKNPIPRLFHPCSQFGGWINPLQMVFHMFFVELIQ